MPAARGTRLTWCLVATIMSTWCPPRADANETVARWAGVWQGTIGKSTVQLCLQADDGARGAYYYRKHLALIAIEVDEPASGQDRVRLRESIHRPRRQGANAPPAQALWQLQASADGKTLSGSWREGREVLPVNLSPVAWDAAGVGATACAGDAFNRPREQPGRLTLKNAVLHGAPYRVLSTDFGGRYDAEVVSFELPGNSQGVQRFNAARRRALHDEEKSVFDCSRNSDFRMGDGDYNSREVPKAITEHWAVLDKTVDWDCGGAHPDSDTTVTTWRLDSGEAVDVWTWFVPTAAAVKHHGQGADRYSTVTIGKPLRALLRRAWPASDDDCGNVGAVADEWVAYPTGAGMGFLPDLPHVEQACAEEVVVPWAQVLPLLNKAGREAVISFRADVAKAMP